MIYPSTALYPSGTAYPEFGPNVIVTNDENTVLFIPQFTFIDDAVTIPFKNVSSSDSAVLSESIAPFVFEPRSDGLTFADNINLFVTLDLLDSASLSEAQALSFEGIDSATANEFINSISIAGPHEHFYVGDVKNIFLSGSDSATASEAVEIGVFIEDSAVVSDFINSIALAQSDQIAATDALISISTFVDTFDLDNTFAEHNEFITADPPGFDHMHWNDEFDYQFIATTLSTFDDPVLSEDIPNIKIPVVDSANVSEFIQISLAGSDQLFNTDQLLSLTINATSEDQFIYQELFELTADVNVNDALNITDASLLAVNAFGTQSITFEENVSITVSVADSGNLTEIVANAFTQSDSLNLIENKRISLTQSDFAILNDLARINANISKTDSAVITERDKNVDLVGKQLIQLVETPFYHADYSRLDYVFLISEIGNASVLKTAEEIFAVTELTSSIALQGLQLITFKEKIGLRQSAPIILNINDNPTVHGTVTGDIISISMGGTEPVLL